MKTKNQVITHIKYSALVLPVCSSFLWSLGAALMLLLLLPLGSRCFAQETADAQAVVINGSVFHAYVTKGGSGYSFPPIVTLVGGGGTGATATAEITNGAVSHITITAAGSGYTSLPTVVIEPPLFDLNDKLVGYWSFQDSVNDDSGKGAHGTVVGSISYPEGILGSAASIGGRSYIDFGNPNDGRFDVGLGEDFSVSIWVKTSMSGSAFHPILLSKETGHVSNRTGWNLNFDNINNASVAFELWVPPTAFGSGRQIAVNDNQWHHMVATKNGTALTFYLDGVLRSTTACADANYSTSIPLTLGISANTSFATYQGAVDELRLYKRALAPREVKALHARLPAINHPTSVLPYAGQTACFVATAIGEEPLNYQWFKDGKSLAQATDATLCITNVQTTEAGAYSVTVSNAFGTVYSQPATLTLCTPVGGNIVNQTWTKDKSPYCVTNDVYVVGLTIREGVRIVVQGNYVFEVGGRLRVLGTAVDPVEFLPENEEVGWQGVLFRDAVPGSFLNHTMIQGSKNSGLRITNTPPALTNCVILNNTSPSHGGGILALVSANNPLILQSCVVSNNAAAPSDTSQSIFGGGICVLGGAWVNDCLIIGNRVGGLWSYGGGLFARGHCTIRNSRIIRNIANGVGGRDYADGIYFDAEPTGSGTMDMANCVVRENGLPGTLGVEAGAGGLWVYTGTAHVRNSLFMDNARYGIIQSSGLSDFANCTVIRNQWHGIVSHNTAARITNCIIYFNYDGGQQISPANLEIGYSCVSGGYAGEGNISFGPSLCPVTFSLLEGSPCIDAGHPGLGYRDGCVSIEDCTPFARGASRNDMGAFGGPLVCHWTDPSSAPKIRIQPNTDIALEGEPAAIDVLAAGDEVLSYQWYRSADNTAILGATNAVLSWTAVRLLDDSFLDGKTNDYFVEVSNAAGAAKSWHASLIVTSSFELTATLKAGDVELTIRRNKPIAQCEIRTAADLNHLVKGPWTVVATVDLTEPLTTWRAPIPSTSSSQFYLAVPVE